MKVKQYIGDAVYAEDDGYRITLTTENGIETTNTIVLEAEVMRDLISWYKRRRITIPLQDADIDEDCR